MKKTLLFMLTTLMSLSSFAQYKADTTKHQKADVVKNSISDSKKQNNSQTLKIGAGLSLGVAGAFMLLNSLDSQPDQSAVTSAMTTDANTTSMLQTQLAAGTISQTQYDVEKQNADNNVTAATNKYNTSVSDYNKTQKNRTKVAGGLTVLSGILLTIGFSIKF